MAFDFASAVIVLVGPLPPPSGGMANQTKQLARFLEREGARVRIVRTNAPYSPRVVGNVRGVRALFRLVPYVRELKRSLRDATLVHVMANSGWSWHLFAAPALWTARRFGVPVVLNYRGGDAARFFARSFGRVERTLRWANRIIVPSRFLKEVFEEFGVTAEIVPNIIDLERFRPAAAVNGSGPRILIARNLEPIYDIATGIRAFSLLRGEVEGASLAVAGTGPERRRLEALARELALGDSIRFLGRIDHEEMPGLYARADIALNASLVDNMPNSILEALASGVPVVSTNVGGVPALVRDGEDAVLVRAGDAEAMAQALVSLWKAPERREALRTAGLETVSQFGWPSVRERWADVYDDVVGGRE